MQVKIFCAAVLAVIFFASIVHAEGEQKKSVWQPEIRIGVLNGVTRFYFQMSEPCVMINPENNEVIQKINADEKITIEVENLEVDAVEIRGEKVQLKDLQTTINGKKYYGGLRVNKREKFLTVINLAPVEEYLRGVVPKEMSASFPVEALKAQAVAARSFTLKNRNRHKADGYDLCSTTHCQFYAGAISFPSSDQAVLETRGEILIYGGAVVDANFHADSGGMTENVVDVWAKKVPYLLPAEELEKETQPWTVKISLQDFCGIIGEKIGALKKINSTQMVIGQSAEDRTQSGRVKFIEIVGEKNTLTISGKDLRTKFSLPSTLFNIRFENEEIIFEGFGRGHGVGMSQKGAQAFAKSGMKYDKILEHYYSGTALKKLY